MARRPGRTPEWVRTLLATAAALAVVGGSLYVVSEAMTRRLPQPGRTPGPLASHRLPGPPSRTAVKPDRVTERPADPSRPPTPGRVARADAPQFSPDGITVAPCFEGPPADTPAPPAGTPPDLKGPATAVDGDAQGPRRKKAAIELARRVWVRRIDRLHDAGLHARGSTADRRESSEKAEAELLTIDDPDAVPGLWAAFAGHTGHHRLMSRILARIPTPESTRCLAVISVRSGDEKARWLATTALRDRPLADFGVTLADQLQQPPVHRRQAQEIPGRGRVHALVVEAEDAVYRSVFLPPPSPNSGPKPPPNVYGPGFEYMTPEVRTQADAMNKAAHDRALAFTEAQVSQAVGQVERYVEQRKALNGQIGRVLAEVTGADCGTDRVAWRRWLADRQGESYEPPPARPKPVFARAIPPFFTPEYLNVPVPT